MATHSSYLENPRDGGAWGAAVYGVVQSRNQLKRLSSSSCRPFIFNVVVDKVGFKFDNVGSYSLFSICSIFEFFSWFIYFLYWLIICSHLFYFCGCFRMFPGGSAGKESACNTEDLGSIPGSERFPGGGHGDPLQYSCLENPMDRGAWWAMVHAVAKSDMSDWACTYTNTYNMHLCYRLGLCVKHLQIPHIWYNTNVCMIEFSRTLYLLIKLVTGCTLSRNLYKQAHPTLRSIPPLAEQTKGCASGKNLPDLSLYILAGPKVLGQRVHRERKKRESSGFLELH